MTDPKRPTDIPISLGKPSLRRRLEAYYSLVNPGSMEDAAKWRNSTFPAIYEKYGGSYEGERKLAAKLAKKYGSTVRLLLAETTLKKNQNRAAAAEPSIRDVVVRDETYFELRPEEQGSRIIDFTSEKFDPLEALRVPEERIVHENAWVSQCPRLNHVDQFRSYLPKSDPLYRDLAAPVRTQNNNDKMEAATKKTKKLGPFASIAENQQQGPWALLHRLFEKRHRVRILVRYVNGIRGTLTGYLIAYDKHFNFLLRDVDEVYCPRPNTITTQQKGNAHTPEVPSNLELELGRRTRALSQTKNQCNQSSSKDWSIRQRHFKQILVRGDSVVMVYKAESERSAWPKTAKSPVKSVHGRKPVVVSPEQRVGSPGSLIYAYQKQQQQQQQQQRKRPYEGSRQDFRSSNR